MSITVTNETIMIVKKITSAMVWYLCDGYIITLLDLIVSIFTINIKYAGGSFTQSLQKNAKKHITGLLQ